MEPQDRSYNLDKLQNTRPLDYCRFRVGEAHLAQPTKLFFTRFSNVSYFYASGYKNREAVQLAV